MLLILNQQTKNAKQTIFREPENPKKSRGLQSELSNNKKVLLKMFDPRPCAARDKRQQCFRLSAFSGPTTFKLQEFEPVAVSI